MQEILAFREWGHAADLFVNVGEIFFMKVRGKITAENKVFIVNQMQQIKEIADGIYKSLDIFTEEVLKRAE